MTKPLRERVHPVYLIDLELRRAAVGPQTKPTDLRHRVRLYLLSLALAINIHSITQPESRYSSSPGGQQGLVLGLGLMTCGLININGGQMVESTETIQ